MRPIVPLATLAILLAILLAGCGASYPSRPTPVAPAKAHYSAHDPGVKSKVESTLSDQLNQDTAAADAAANRVGAYATDKSCIATSDTALDCTFLMSDGTQRAWQVNVDPDTGEFHARATP